MELSRLVVLLLLSLGPSVLVEASVRGIRKRKLQLQLVAYGGEPDSSRFPLQECEGDCDDSTDCDVGLICFQREEPPPGQAWPEVPGCIGGSAFAAKTDFCIQAPIENAKGAPTETPTMVPTEAPSGTPSQGLTQTPTTQRDVQSTGPTPTMAPTTATPSMMPSEESYWDLPELNYVGNDGNLQGMPLGLCMGDCDTDNDCLDEMVCFQRSFQQPIPGCRGIGRPSMDYCILPPPPPTEAVVTQSPTIGMTMAATEMIVALQTVGDANGIPLGLCQGDCDVDEDCLDTLICFQRTYLEEVPGCAGEGSPSFDYCIVDPFAVTTASPTTTTTVGSSAPTQLPLVVEAMEPPPSAAPSQAPSPLLVTVNKNDREGPLGLCQGKCSSDEDCEGDLVCMDRDSEDEVPGCGGEPNKADDYCIHAS